MDTKIIIIIMFVVKYISKNNKDKYIRSNTT